MTMIRIAELQIHFSVAALTYESVALGLYPADDPQLAAELLTLAAAHRKAAQVYEGELSRLSTLERDTAKFHEYTIAQAKRAETGAGHAAGKGA